MYKNKRVFNSFMKGACPLKYDWAALEAFEQKCTELGLDPMELDLTPEEMAELVMPPSEFEAFEKFLKEADNKLESHNSTSLY